MTCCVALDVGGTSMKGALVSAGGDVSGFERRPTVPDAGPAEVIERILGFAADLAAGAHERPVAAGVVVPGLVDERAGIASYAANLGWRDVPLRAMIEERLGIPAALGHDVRAGGLAEAVQGSGGGAEDFLFLAIGAGIAAAMIFRGRPYGGARGWAGEIGHVPVWPDGERCACGQRGCLETYASAAAIARRYGGGATTEEIFDRNDPAAVRVVSEATEALSIVLAGYSLLLDPELIVIGGGLSGAGERLLSPLRKGIASRLAFRDAPPIRTAALGPRAAMLGAALLARRRAGEDDGG